jgi:hypothetical protein
VTFIWEQSADQKGFHAGSLPLSSVEPRIRYREQASDLAGVDLVILGLAAVDGFQVQGVSKDKSDLLFLTEVGEPVPGEPALDADD